MKTANIKLFQSRIREVAKFNKFFNLPYSDVPVLIPERILLEKIEFIKDEIQELRDAVQKGDIVEIVDALVDIEYFLFGLVCAYGLQDTVIEITNPVIGSGKYFETNHFVNIGESLRLNPEIEMGIARLLNALGNLKEEKRSYFIGPQLVTAIGFVYHLVNDFGVMTKFHQCFEIIHGSNMSKLCYSMTEARATLDKLAGEPGEFDFVRLSQSEEIYKVFKVSNGKVQKSINYKAPDLKPVLQEWIR